MKQHFVAKNNYIDSDVAYFVSCGYPPSLARLMSIKGFTEQNFQQSLSYNVDNFYDPFLMSGMLNAVNIIKSAMSSGKSILIYGDYDADGLSASAVLSTFFTHNGVDNDVIIPTREDGYGMHVNLIADALTVKQYAVVITVDCGISNKQEIEELQRIFGDSVTFVVTDHHELPQELPNCICVNPKLGYPFAMLSGSGVAYKLVEAISNRQTAIKYADLAIIGTVADLMPLTDENRTLVKCGLDNFTHKSLVKLAELCKITSKRPTVQDIAMKIAPKINAAGRVGNPRKALEVLLACDKANSDDLEQLLQCNEQRKVLTESVTAQALQQLTQQNFVQNRLVFVKGEDWQHGVLGIVAGRLKEQYNLPAVVMTADGDCYVGSARGTDGVDLHKIFSNCQNLLERFGGHKSSVGFSVSRQNVDKLYEQLASQLVELPQQFFEQSVSYDIALGEDGLTVNDIWQFVENLQPLLPQEQSKVYIKDYVKFANVFGKDSTHVSFTLGSGLQVKAFFDYTQYLPALKSGAEVELVANLTMDTYSNTIQAIVTNIALCNSLHFEQLYVCNYLEAILPQKVNRQYITQEQANKLISSNTSTLCVFDDYESFSKVLDKLPQLNNFTLDFFVATEHSSKMCVIAPNVDFDYTNFANVIVFFNSKLLMRSYCDNAIYVNCSIEKDILSQLTVDRDCCVAVWKALKAKQFFDTTQSVFDKYLLGKISYEQYVACCQIFIELGLWDKQKQVIMDGKVQLNDSYIFTQLSQCKK